MKLANRSSRILISGLALLALTSALHAQVEVWKSQYSAGGTTCFGKRIALSPDSAVVVAVTYADAVGKRSLAMLKYSTRTGDTLWTTRWLGDSMADSSRVWAMAVDDSGNIFAACYTAVGLNWDWLTLKYLPDGTLAWAARYDNGGFDVPLCILPDGRGGAFTAGSSTTTTGWVDATAIHYNASGDSTWFFRIDGPAHVRDHFWALAPGPDGSVYAAGDITITTENAYDWLVVRFDSLGDTLWTRTYDGTSSGNPLIENDVVVTLTTDAFGNCYAVGKAGEAGEWVNAVTLKYAPDGTQEWLHSFDWGSAGTEAASHIGVDSFGNVYVGGCVDEGDGWDMLVYSLSQDSMPSLRWRRRFNYVNAGDDDSLTGMAVDGSGNVYLTGLSNTTNLDIEWWTLKLSPWGDTIWSVTNGQLDTDNAPYGLVLDERGDVYVTGYETPSGSQPEQAATVRYTENDVGVVRIAMPADTFRLGATVTPRAWVRNYGGMMERSFPVRLDIGSLYTDAENVDSIPPFDSVLVRFTSLRIEERALGTHPMACYTMLSQDKERVNDTVRSRLTGVAVWEQLASLPAGPKNKDIKDGGALGFFPDTLVFAFKGNNTTEFYAFNTLRGAWQAKESIPAIGRSGSKKRVKAGGRLAGDTIGHVYALKGNNSLEFWRYSVAADSWKQMDDMPFGASNKKAKGGAVLVYVPPQNRLYAAKGAGTLEFYTFDVARDTWLPRTSVPAGPANRKLKDGTVAAFDGLSTIYLMKGSTYEFWSYNVYSDSWTKRPDLRNSRLSSKKKKMKKGAGMAFDPQFRRAWTMKGGKLIEFWFFDAAGDSWHETDDLFPMPPLGRAPYAGGDLCYGAGKVYAFRGNKTRDFYRYHANFPLTPPDTWDGAQARPANLARLTLFAAPNPVVRLSWLHYSLPAPGHVRLAVYDVSGRVCRVVWDGRQLRGEHVVPLRAEGLAAGVYVVKLWLTTDAKTDVVTRKVLIAR